MSHRFVSVKWPVYLVSVREWWTNVPWHIIGCLEMIVVPAHGVIVRLFVMVTLGKWAFRNGFNNLWLGDLGLNSFLESPIPCLEGGSTNPFVTLAESLGKGSVGSIAFGWTSCHHVDIDDKQQIFIVVRL
ncbi:hypothetical protein Tco_0790294 [Tanacetum coccineum]